METLGGCLCVLLAPIGSLWLLGQLILGPLDQAARRRRGPTQFTMLDFLCLIFLIQLPMGLLQATFVRGSELGGAAGRVLYVVGAVIGGLMWWVSVRQLSGAGVTLTAHRGGFLALVLPVAFFGSIAMIVLAVLLVNEVGLAWQLSPNVPYILTAMGLLAVAFYCSARYTRWIVRQSDPDLSRSQIEDGSNQ